MPFDEHQADRAVRFIRRLRHTKGRWAGFPFNLRGWQEEIIRELFGRMNDDGYRRYRTLYLEIPRKNGKSELAAALALKLLFADSEAGAEIYSAAADRSQAALVFNVAAQMVRQAPALDSRCKVIDSQKRILRYETGSYYTAISSESYTKHGLNAHGIIFDELHAQPNRDLWDVLTTSTGSRTQPLVVALTTAGFDRHSICWEIHSYALRVLKHRDPKNWSHVRGEPVDDPTFFPVIYAAGKDDDWCDEGVWHRSNPALGNFRSLEEMRTFHRRALETPALENTFRRLYLNQWTQQETRYIPMGKWDECNDQVDTSTLVGCPCYAGLDLASTTDIAALVLVWPPQDDDGSYVVLPKFWIPENGLADRARRDRVPYEMWARAGLISPTPGNVIDYRHILLEIDELAQLFDIVELAFDRWGATRIVQDLEDRGMDVVQFGQGFASMSPPTKELLNLILSGRLLHGGHPVLRWMADNLIVRLDPAGNVKPDKSKSTEKIDGIVALIMALDRALRRGGSAKSIYEERGIIVL